MTGDIPEWVRVRAEQLQPYCLCCGREIAAGDVCGDCEAETGMLAELARLRSGDGTADELADYAATRTMILDGE